MDNQGFVALSSLLLSVFELSQNKTFFSLFSTQALHCNARASLVVGHRLSCPWECGILVPQQGLNPHPLHWKVDS